ncbi:MAG: alpha-glucosidase C-terminal domain-containing protein [Candidatus Riflebacteria bacterium]|nr:alpha-glucosidase C-terminal domain-containing protein [Candidatus Riflebacteria bacterium]
MPNSYSPLNEVKKELLELSKKNLNFDYFVPTLWTSIGTQPGQNFGKKRVNPGKFFLEHIEAIEKNSLGKINPLKSLNSQLQDGKGGSWVSLGPIFNLFVRLGTAFDHDGDGKIGGQKEPTLNSHGVRETGTFLKAIALLGHIKSFGTKTIHLLPVTSIGRDGNKGTLGSPYAIKNPYEIESSLADPLIQVSVEDQFKAFIEASHLLGMRVVCEFVFRTASKDADWIKEHPDWFYWIDTRIEDRLPSEKSIEKAKKQYGNPIFSQEELKVINQKVSSNDFNELPAPPKEFRNFFKFPPAKGKIKMNNLGQLIGESIDPETHETLKTRIPGAFADWPPDDTQPPWGDVTYLRMYVDENQQNPKFNYIAYNTIRMYDSELARDNLANSSLWEKIIALVPYYQNTYGIDGVMVDMGHAVPVNLMKKIVETAKQNDPDFAFLSENFSIEESSVKAGYNAVVGYAWWVEYKREGLKDLLENMGIRGVPLHFFGAVENHNTPRAAARDGGERYAMYSFLLNSFLPKSIPFIHSGFELGDTAPINTGLDFKPEEVEKLKAFPLALFDISALPWTKSSKMLPFTRLVMRIFKENISILQQSEKISFFLLETENPDVFAYLRFDDKTKIMVLLNRDLNSPQKACIHLENFNGNCHSQFENLLNEFSGIKNLKLSNGRINEELPPGSCHLSIWE